MASAATTGGSDQLHGKTLLGDPLGLRSGLASRGISLYLGFVGEMASDVAGGRARGKTWADQFAIGADGDLGRLAGWKGAKLHALLLSRQGVDASAKYVGNIFQVQEIYGGRDDARLLFLNVEQALWSNRLNIVAGRVAESSDFANASYFCHFQTLAICGVPNTLSLNGSFTFWPFATWGGRVRLRLHNRWQLQTGVYEINPLVYARDGFNFSTRGATGVSVPFELGLQTPTGHFKLGYVYDSSRTTDLLRDASGQPYARTGAQPGRHQGRSTGYASFERVLAGSRETGRRNLVLFGGATAAEADRSLFENFEYAGLIATGPLKARSADVAALFVGNGNFSHDLTRAEQLGALPVQRRETVVEADYAVQALPWLSVMPNIQFILRPNGTRQYSDATVIGMETNISL